MATVALQIWTGAYPTISDDLTIDVYDQGDPLAIIASATHAGPTHGADTWSFPGLDRQNLLFRIFQTSGGSIIRQLGFDMNVVPGMYTGTLTRDTEQIEADVTAGFSSGVNQVVFDGTSGKEDWRGWDISTLNRMGGVGVMKKGIDYSWNINTGTLTLLNAGDLFNPNEWFNVSFAAQVSQITESVPNSVPVFSTPKVITANYAVVAGTDFGSVLIIRPASAYLEITFPAIATVPANKRLKLEFDPGASQQCAKMIFQTGEVLSWLQGNRNNLYMCNQESIYIYPFVDTDATKRWRVDAPFGNWLKVGEQLVDDNIVTNVFNKVLMDGGTLNGTSANGLDTKQFARLYNDFVLSLPAAEVCNYDAWATGTNKYLYSLANSANPANAGKFRIPNRLGLFERITDGSRTPGNYGAPALLQHSHYNGVADDKPAGDSASVFVYGTTATGMPGAARGQISNGTGGDIYQGLTSNTGTTDHCPANIAVRKYLIV